MIKNYFDSHPTVDMFYKVGENMFFPKNKNSADIESFRTKIEIEIVYRKDMDEKEDIIVTPKRKKGVKKVNKLKI